MHSQLLVRLRRDLKGGLCSRLTPISLGHGGACDETTMPLLLLLLLLVGCLTSQQHASVSQGQIRTDRFTCCHTETEVADQAFAMLVSKEKMSDHLTLFLVCRPTVRYLLSLIFSS